MKNSNIEWTDHTWNPVTGCTQVSPGCDRCYAKAIAEQRRGPAFPSGFDITLRPHKLREPAKWREPPWCSSTPYPTSFTGIFPTTTWKWRFLATAGPALCRPSEVVPT